MFRFTRPNGQQGELKISNINDIFYEKLSSGIRWLNLAQDRGIPHCRMEEARESKEWIKAAESFVSKVCSDRVVCDAVVKLLIKTTYWRN